MTKCGPIFWIEGCK